MSNRKTAGTGAAPGPQNQQQRIVYPTGANTTDAANVSYTGWDGVNAFAGSGGNLPDTSGFDNNFFGSNTPTDLLPQNLAMDGDSSTSNQLVRRNRNNQLAVQNRTLDPDTWQDFGPESQGPGWENAEEEEDLEEKAIQARKEAQSKRKTIPPFVQKLSSFLDEKRNTDLIRWSDDGNSFIVLNEDEFAKTLIPELFKHNNYASFVRQLNMYGFHKKVGLSDNSMKSSESKVKNPSEYYNKYFKRGRPELLWLIQKPRTAAAGKRKREDEKIKGGDSDDDGKKYLQPAESRNDNEGVVRRNQEMAIIPSREITNMKTKLRSVQQQQKLISQAINRIRQQNDQLYSQARAFQNLHDRHENSINAILTFLATFYNRSLETNNGPNIAEMFAHVMPQNAPNQNHGSVVDVGDYHEEQDRSKVTPLRRKQPLALLPAPEAKEVEASPLTQASRAATTRSPSARPTSRQNSIFKSKPSNSPAAKPKSPPVKVEAPTPPSATVAPENDEIMSIIQNSNANQDVKASQSPQMDFNAALNHFQNSDGGQLSAQQRNQLLSYMAANSPNTSSPNGNSSTDNALLNPEPPPMPPLDTFMNTQSQLDILQKMQQEQNDKVQALADRLQPLSPTGSIPGYVPPPGDPNNFYGSFAGAEPSDLDINSFINSDDYFPNTDSNGQFPNAGDSILPDLNFDFGNTNAFDTSNGFGNGGTDDLFGTNDEDFNGFSNGDNLDENRIESVSSEAPSPANLPDPIPAGDSNPDNPRKRRKK